MATTTVSLKKAEWKAKRVVMKEIMNCGGTLFGGAVRDWVLHDHFAQRYYATEGVSEKELHERYGDETFMPELKDRMVVPTDVDACVTAKQLEKVLSGLRKKKLTMFKEFSRDPASYIDGWTLPLGKVKHVRYQVMVRPANLFPALYTSLFADVACVVKDRIMALARELEAVLDGAEGERSFHMDLLVFKEAYAYVPTEVPFAPLDFQCNGLLMNSERGLFLSNQVVRQRDNPMSYHQAYMDVLKDVLNRRAVRNDTWREIAPYRVSNMLAKGWEIGDFQFVKRVEPEAGQDAPVCMICHDDLHNTHYKMKCCEARMHLACVHGAMTQGVAAMADTYQCIMCRRELSSGVCDDAAILGSILAYFDPPKADGEEAEAQ